MPHRKLREVVAGQTLVFVTPDTTVLDAMKLMQQHRYSCLPVIRDGELQGIFTSTSLFRNVLDVGREPADTLVSQVMTPDPKCLDADALGFDAIHLMRDEGIRHVVVTGCGPEGCAVVTSDDFPGKEIAEFDEELAFEQRLWEEL